ncbi:MAG TPA: fructose-bisphosphatase class III, partial [Anaerolineales bacterium]|nr:fructose-bisphosphatase class III [Anaerolineales bacterium]
GVVSLDGQEYPLINHNFPTLDPQDPYRLSEDEKSVVEKLLLSFVHNERLQQHVQFLYAHGSMYTLYNGNLLYHGCILTEADGSFTEVTLDGQTYRPRAYLDRLEQLARRAYFATDDPQVKRQGMDTMWYLWSGPNSPLFGKDKMATFERYFIADPATHKESMNAYYIYRDQTSFVRRILEEFGLDPQTAHIVNGHVPVKVKKGEQPVKADGQMLVIDGGFSRAYQSQTGIAGYTLIYNSYGFLLSAHNPLESRQKAIAEERDLDSETSVLETNFNRIRIKDTDQGRAIMRSIEELKLLLNAYRKGLIKEQPQQSQPHARSRLGL